MQGFIHSKGCDHSFIPFRNLDRRAMYKNGGFVVLVGLFGVVQNLDFMGVRSRFRKKNTTQNLGYT